MTYWLHHGDLPEGVDFGAAVAIDTEAMGLNPRRDRLCLVQLSAGDGDAHLVQFAPGAYEAPRLRRLLADPCVTKLFHFARFDLAMLYHYLGIMATPVYCTKIASRLARTFTDRHGLRDLCKDLLNVDLSKQQQSSDWGALEFDRRAAALRRLGRAPSSCAARAARRDAGARGARGAGPCRLRFSAAPRAA